MIWREGMLTPEQIERFSADGAVTVDSPFTETELTAAAAAIRRVLPEGNTGTWGGVEMRRDSRDCCLDEELTTLVQHPFLEALACSALGVERVAVHAMAAARSFPFPGGRPGFWEHIDLAYRLSDLEARPRRMVCSCVVWLTDVTPERAPLMFRPGSHRLIAAHRERDPAAIGEGQSWMSALPSLPFAAPVPMLARRGQVSVLTTAAIHGASVNLDTQDRLCIFVPMFPVGVPLSAHIRSELERYSPYHRALLPLLRPERRHLVTAPLPEVAVNPAVVG
jgi:hypothetical protein